MPVIMTSIIVEVFPWNRYPSRLKTDRYRAAMDISVIFFDTEHRNSLVENARKVL